jgi:hypothetical protein
MAGLTVPLSLLGRAGSSGFCFRWFRTRSSATRLFRRRRAKAYVASDGDKRKR